MAHTYEADRDLVAALKVSPFIRVKKGQPKPKYVAPTDVDLDGELAAKFMTQIVARTGHYGEKKLAEFGSVAKIHGTAKADPAHGKLIGAAFGRFWYSQ